MEVNINVGLQKVTFDGANVTSKIDADLYHFLFSNSIGIIEGLKNSVSFSLSNKTITFQDGYISIYGRIIYVEGGTSINILTDSSRYGCVVVGINTANNSVSLYTKEQSGSYPSLVTTHLPTVDGLYEFPLCAYTKNTTTVTLVQNFTRTMIRPVQHAIDVAKSEVINDLSYKRITFNYVQMGVYRFTINYNDLINGLLIVMMGSSHPIVVPGAFMFTGSGSVRTITYNYFGSVYSLRLSYLNGAITLTCGDTYHWITSIHLYK